VTSVFIRSLKLRNCIPETKILKERIMWSILVNLSIRILASYTGSPYAQQIVRQVVVDLATEGAKAVPVIIDAVKEAAQDDKLTGRGKFDYVANKVATETQDVGRSVANSMIDMVYRALKSDPMVPGVQ
jgi:hypothetical protein